MVLYMLHSRARVGDFHPVLVVRTALYSFKLVKITFFQILVFLIGVGELEILRALLNLQHIKHEAACSLTVLPHTPAFSSSRVSNPRS